MTKVIKHSLFACLQSLHAEALHVTSDDFFIIFIKIFFLFLVNQMK